LQDICATPWEKHAKFAPGCLAMSFVSGLWQEIATMKQLKKTLLLGWSFRVLCRDTFFLFTKIWHDQVGICHIFVGRMVGEV
jgi:hypothetical protein